ncbi:hypothetical protein BS47DRAFT_1490669 [Hydnum rufescens UP504]|uniref:Uncharacterized protein n=1 Tax=Hydnum rufescens UP504 TaxID=1448309 RepID=A0A9P6AAW9_9AGAM|nr:hypothetical protein BS47DRAFT_1490669 [Hydnum rufescens UP504]
MIKPSFGAQDIHRVPLQRSRMASLVIDAFHPETQDNSNLKIKGANSILAVESLLVLGDKSTDTSRCRVILDTRRERVFVRHEVAPMAEEGKCGAKYNKVRGSECMKISLSVTSDTYEYRLCKKSRRLAITCWQSHVRYNRDLRSHSGEVDLD